MIDYNCTDLVQILTKIDAVNGFWTPYKCIKFQLNWSTSLRVTMIFSSVGKNEENTLESLLTHISKTLCAIFFEFGV